MFCEPNPQNCENMSDILREGDIIKAVLDFRSNIFSVSICNDQKIRKYRSHLQYF